LLIEDDDVDRRRVHRAVSKMAAKIELIDAVDITSGCEALADGVFDCCVVDYNLPDGTALDLLAFNAGAGASRVPVVVLTGDDDHQRAVEALKCGAEDYLVKSRFEGDAFLRSLSYAIERHRLRGDLERSNARLQKELQIGGNIQTSILPRDLKVRGLDIAARMAPATEVGGDYYDVQPTDFGCWIAIGDVAGHGMSAAIVALMTQSSIATSIRANPNAHPSEVVSLVNEVLHDNIRHRLTQDEHVTLTLFRYEHGGKVSYAGAHEELVVYRARTRRVETLATPGTWLGARRDISAVTSDSDLWLAPGDALVLYSDGITEAMNESGEQYGLERLMEVTENCQEDAAVSMHANIWQDVTRFRAAQDDDMTLLVIRRAV
jgi:serine phosphatase RsbU (regulator of sigma subunit)